MALTSNNQNQGKLYILKPRGKDKEGNPTKYHFEITEKVENVYKVTGETNNITGDLVSVSAKKGEWEGNAFYEAKLTLEDNTANPPERYILDLRLSLAVRSLINGVLNLKSGKNIQIGAYDTKPKEAGGRSYPALSLRQNDVRVDWLFKTEDLPAVEKVNFKGKEMTDTTNVDEFYLTKLNEFSEVVKGWRLVSQSEPKAADKGVEKSESAKNDDIPF